jgi:hypothetical protein
LNYKVVDLVESYNFHLKLPPSEFNKKNLQIFEKKFTFATIHFCKIDVKKIENFFPL